MAHKNDVGVVWHHCDINGCTYKAKDSGNLKKHKMHVHDIDVIWHHCGIAHIKPNVLVPLKKHKLDVHDISITDDKIL